MLEMDDIIRELRIALNKNDEDLRKDVERIVRKYGRKRRGSKKGTFGIKAGYTYYINEKKPLYARKIFKQIVERDIAGLYMGRTNPEEIEFGDYDNVRIYWITTMKGTNKVSPSDLTKIHAVIAEFIKNNERGVVILEGIETIITNTDFIKVLHLLQRLRDLMSDRKGILIISIDMDTLSQKDRALFKKEIINEIPVKKSVG